MTVGTILKGKGSRVVSVKAGDTVESAARLMGRERIGAVLVCDEGGKVCGILSERDIVRGLGEQGGALLAQPVTVVMTAEVVRCAPGDSILGAMARMTERRFRHLPVFDGDELLGIVSIGDVVKHRISEVETEAAALRDYINS